MLSIYRISHVTFFLFISCYHDQGGMSLSDIVFVVVLDISKRAQLRSQ